MEIPTIVLVFIICIALILLSPNMLTVMSIAVNAMLITVLFNPNILRIEIPSWGASTEDSANTSAASAASAASAITNNNPQQSEGFANDNQTVDLYGPYYEMWHSYHDTSMYEPPRPVVGATCAERSQSVDMANVFMAQQRARDKKCSDGWAVKDANYYRHHYGGELDQAEAKAWWGRGDY